MTNPAPLCKRLDGFRWRAFFAILALPTLLGAVSLPEGGDVLLVSVFDWEHSWSVWKFAIFAALSAAWWWACFAIIFKRLIGTGRQTAMWPRDAYARSMAAFVSGVIFAFVVCFSLENKKGLRSVGLGPWEFGGDSAGQFLNTNWLWILLLIVSVITQFVVFQMLKHKLQSQAV